MIENILPKEKGKKYKSPCKKENDLSIRIFQKLKMKKSKSNQNHARGDTRQSIHQNYLTLGNDF